MAGGFLQPGLRLWSRLAPTGRGAFRLVRLVRRTIPRDRWRGRFTLPSGLQMDLDLGVYPDCCMAYGLYELDTARLIRNTLRPGDRAADGGANIGYFTLLMAQRVGAAGHIDAFEPEPHNRARLVEHLTLNNLSDRVTVHDAALSDSAGEATIHFYPPGDATHNHGCSTLFAAPGDRTEATRVRTVRMDDVVTAMPKLIKLDLEGAEPLAIAGAAGLLRADAPPVIVGELNPRQATVAGTTADEWVRRALAIQPRYRLEVIGARRRIVAVTRLAKDREVNLVLRV